ncbi:6147_t:CDS:2, partial [Entrophospora sp. SA101]
SDKYLFYFYANYNRPTNPGEPPLRRKKGQKEQHINFAIFNLILATFQPIAFPNGRIFKSTKKRDLWKEGLLGYCKMCKGNPKLIGNARAKKEFDAYNNLQDDFCYSKIKAIEKHAIFPKYHYI